MLHFGMRPPLSFEKFLRICEELIPEADVEALKAVSLAEYSPLPASSLSRWRAFDTALRNELAKIRASRKHIDAHRYLREDGYADPYIAHAAMAAHRTPSVIEAEKALDQERWRALDEISLGHYFDIDALIVYAYKLKILERWEQIRVTDKKRALAEATSA